ncbi:MAG: EamA family transporter RarD [Corynebacterium sp.]|uniref:EamA family transporter RarD n=1 Tax=Corynebacterium sp. TaxID=1720 RepID=UPI0026DCAC64|nr:EamA family transporter RarD [Corynebacterium sp.]MDO5098847.1 EamA family transporter RarD [Corynebacterium sp.]
MIFALAAYLLWGLFPAFFPLLEPASPVEIIAHRIAWTAVIMVGVVVVTGGFRQLRTASLKLWLHIAAAGGLIAVNWLVYVMAVNSSHVADAALGYFINPLVNVLLGIVFLHERLRPAQMASIIIAATAVAILTLLAGQPPVVALLLAFSFGFYGLVKKRIPLPASVSLAAETLVLAPVAIGYIVVIEATGTGTFLSHGAGHSLLLVSAGLVTAVPLLLFGMAAKQVPLSTIGMLQYLTPTMQMLWAVFVTREHIEPIRWVAFSIIWVAVILFLFDTYRHRRTPRPARSASVSSEPDEPRTGSTPRPAAESPPPPPPGHD